jgi:hypothetical protein
MSKLNSNFANDKRNKYMKKIFYMAVIALALTACGNSEKTEAQAKVATDYISDSVATAIVPQAATEVIPAAAPGPDSGGKVATEVIPNE